MMLFSVLLVALLFFAWPITGDSTEDKLINLSTNGYVGEAGLRAGFILSGTEPRRIVVLGEQFQSNINAKLRITDLTETTEYTANDDWHTHANAQELVSILGRTPGALTDAALLVTLQPGVYIAILESSNNIYGPGIVAINDLAPDTTDALLINISTKALLNTTERLSAGFIISGSLPKRIIILGEYADFESQDVALALRDTAGNGIYFNDNWGDDRSAAEIERLLRAPNSVSDAGFAITLAPGVYIADLDSDATVPHNVIVAINDVAPPVSSTDIIKPEQLFNTQWQGIRRLTSLGSLFPGAFCEWQVQLQFNENLTGVANAQLITDSTNGLVGCPESLTVEFEWDIRGDVIAATIQHIEGADSLLFGNDSPCGPVDSLRMDGQSTLFENVIHDLTISELVRVRVNCTGDYERF